MPMFVCLCNGITDRDILCAISRGVDTMDKLANELSVTTICGSCREEIEEILQKTERKSDNFLKIVEIKS